MHYKWKVPDHLNLQIKHSTQKPIMSQPALWFILVIPKLSKLRKTDCHEFKASLGYRARTYLQKFKYTHRYRQTDRHTQIQNIKVKLVRSSYMTQAEAGTYRLPGQLGLYNEILTQIKTKPNYAGLGVQLCGKVLVQPVQALGSDLSTSTK